MDWLTPEIVQLIEQALIAILAVVLALLGYDKVIVTRRNRRM